ncbi:MAG: hypothetical protein NTX50_26835 [Candidatus Sumerlaeota bacterium]|nr:hypothetical protein [Candidatus Sumerlaeota bacterium]
MANIDLQNQVLSCIVGQELNSVVFVCDYIRLVFDDCNITAINDPIIEYKGQIFDIMTPGYRDELCKRIFRKVNFAQIFEGDCLMLKFDDDSTLRVSIKEEDHIYCERFWFGTKENPITILY